MLKVVRINIEEGEKTYRDLENRLIEFLKKIRTWFEIEKVLVYGSFAKRELNEGSDIDIIMIGGFKGRMHERILEVLRETDLPIEPLCYTEDEFQKMLENKNPLILEALEKGYWLNI
ncbi:MAG: nucleotidyltransferase domain-containing protein [Thaumarchaeota archaeon]|jgi:predicted nucleotidyltransferase|nr:nucleotidyltransferase domain-containing protein [Nitrososphaerota archaeon]